MLFNTCEQCSTSFIPTKGGRNPGRFCSTNCSQAYQKDLNIHAKNEANYMLHPRQCLNCNSVISYNKVIKDKKRKFCSRSCSAIYSNKVRPKNSRTKQSITLRTRIHQQRSTELKYDTWKTQSCLYKRHCQFKFKNNETKIQGYDLLLKFGLYHPKKNPNGVVKDHKYSIYQGFIEGILPCIISHPANCQWLLYKDNSKKSSTCSITLDELIKVISTWNDL